MKKWVVSQIDKEKTAQIARQCDIPEFVAMLLCIRGIDTPLQVEEFLSDEPVFESPFVMKDMDKAVLRINTALNDYEKICIYGDYDADGVTSTALLYSYLTVVGADVIYMIPNREEDGYGLNKRALDILKEQNVSLVITVDNGVTAVEEIAYANSLNIDIVVTDHHRPGGILPDAVAVVNPHRIDCPSSFKQLSGAGVAFKLIMALEGDECDIYSLLENYADIACIGTVGDIVELKGENRCLVKSGLNAIARTEHQGVLALLREAGVNPEDVSATQLAYSVVPRINALGRLGSCDEMVDFIIGDDYEQATLIAHEIGKNNKNRQEIEKEIFASAIKMINNDPLLKYKRVLVVSGEGWHPGVIGIVAARIKEIYGKPTIVIAISGDTAKGSGRSAPGFSLCDAIFHCKELLTHCGGHPMAAGLSINTVNIDKFDKMINDYACRLEMPYPTLNIDCKLNPAVLNVETIRQLEMLEPCGAGNPEALFGLYNMTLLSITPVGNGNHLRLQFKRNNTKITAMLFGCKSEEFCYHTGDLIDLAVRISINTYNGIESLSIIIRDMRYANDDTVSMLNSIRCFEKAMLKESLSLEEINSIYPNRDDFALVYRFLRGANSNIFYINDIYKKLSVNNINCGKISVIIKAMEQLKLINAENIGDKYIISLNNIQGKANLEDADIIKFLKIRLGEV